jgi:hypothetical protein
MEGSKNCLFFEMGMVRWREVMRGFALGAFLVLLLLLRRGAILRFDDRLAHEDVI